MGQVINHLNMEKKVHGAAYQPIHLQLYAIIPQLEARRQAAIRYIESRNTETKDTMMDVIRQFDANIMEILNMQTPVI